jgi:hypothetical protein
MQVFISWSGERSRKIAAALKDWLPPLIQSVDAWVSSKDIEKGTLSLAEINQQLKDAKFGIVCLTPENKAEKWIHFEAGAIAKAVTTENGKLWTYLMGLAHSDVEGPLGQFQHTIANEEDTRNLLFAINEASNKQLSDSQLDKLFEKFWPDLHSKLEEIAKIKVVESAPKRTGDSMLEEILELIRGLVRTRSENAQVRTALIEMMESGRARTMLPQALRLGVETYSPGDPMTMGTPPLTIRKEIRRTEQRTARERAEGEETPAASG